MATSREQSQPLIHFNVGAATDIGRKRSQNQDNFASCPDLGLFVVADGMGGHRGGEIASRIAVDRITQETRDILRRLEGQPNPPSAREIVGEAIRRANSSIFERSSKEPELRGMGTTATALFFHRKGQNEEGVSLAIGHVGDSRCYLYREGALWQLTRDHSLVQEKLRAGLITRDAARVDTMKNVITRSVGFEQGVDVETYASEVCHGDLFLICSDGLSGLLDDDRIRSNLERAEREGQAPEVSVKALVEDANSAGGDDNITGILIEVP